MPELAAVVPTLVVAGAVDVALPAAVAAAVVLGAVVVVLGAVESAPWRPWSGPRSWCSAPVVAGAALVVLAAGTRC